MANKTIPNLLDYGSQDTDKIKKDLLEITKNDGTYASPSYPTGASRKITVEELKTALAIDASFIKDLVLKYNTDTVLEIGKINWVLLNNNHTMSIATPDASNLGKICLVTNRVLPHHSGPGGPYTITITGTNATPLEITGENSIVGLVCVTDGVAYGWEVFSRYNVGDFDLVSQTITNGVTDKSPSEDAVFDALALKEPTITKNSLSTPLVWTSANGVASFQPIPVLGDLTYYFTNTASDVATYYKQTATPQVALTSLPFASVTDGQLLATFISEPSNPNRLSIPDGQYLNHLHLGKTGGTKDLQVRAEIWETTSAGVDIVKLADLGPSAILVGSGSIEYVIGYNTLEKTLSAVTSRIATKLYAVVGVSGSAPSISIFQGDGSDSRSNLPAPIVDASNYVPYVGALNDVDLGSKKITAQDVTISSATVSTPTFFDTAKKLITTTAQLWGTWVQTWASKATPVDADTIGFHDSATTFVGVKSTLLNLWNTYFKVKADLLYLKSAGLTNNYIPLFNGTNLVDSVLINATNAIVTTTKAVVGKTISGGNTAYTGRYNQASHPDYYGTDTMQSAILNTTAKGLHLYGAGLLMPYIQSSGWLSRTTGVQKYHDGQDFGGGNNPSWNYAGAYPEGIYHAYVSLNNLTDTCESYITVNGSGNVTNIDVIKPSSNITFSIVTNKVNIAAATAIIVIFKYIGASKTNSQLINQTYSSTGLASYWTGSEGFGVGHSSQNASAIFQVESTAKGSIPYPRMTNIQRTNLTVNATTYGLMVYCTDATEGLWIYKSTGWTFII